MSENNAQLINAPPRVQTPPLMLNGLEEVLKLGQVLAASGFFADAKTAAQAVVKILAGRELGFPAVASIIGIHIIEGKPSVGSHLLAAAIRGSGRYDYEILEHTDHVCAVRFARRRPDGTWQALEPVERLTLKEAQDKGWTVAKNGQAKGPWLKTPKNMLFARVLTNGHKFHCPDLFSGLMVYDADELDGEPTIPEADKPRLREQLAEADRLHAEMLAERSMPVVQAPPPVESPRPNPAAPLSPAGPLTEQEVAELTALARSANPQRPQPLSMGQVKAILAVVQAPVLAKAPRERLEWLRQAITTGLCPTVQVDRIAGLVTELQLEWPAFRSRLKQRFGVETIAHLLPAQAEEVEQGLQARKQRRQQPAPAA